MYINIMLQINKEAFFRRFWIKEPQRSEKFFLPKRGIPLMSLP